ncbi:unnamed protein product [Lactuca virosa]|uniref:Uncharacterized protein n=1 Tax=Lactuca virosa TaxID=75947 RepID=A0AAU9LM25_9ASTR|nr:unnamed protein product [Lactuca virosa]
MVAPCGGVKKSGLECESSKYGIEDYLEIKYIWMRRELKFLRLLRLIRVSDDLLDHIVLRYPVAPRWKSR